MPLRAHRQAHTFYTDDTLKFPRLPLVRALHAPKLTNTHTPLPKPRHSTLVTPSTLPSACVRACVHGLPAARTLARSCGARAGSAMLESIDHFLRRMHNHAAQKQT